MAYNEQLAERISNILQYENVPYYEKKMFGGLAFMIEDKMCVGIVKEELMLRVLDSKFESVLKMEGARAMDFTGKRMNGFVYISEDAMIKDVDLKKWVDLGIEFGKKGELKTKKKKAVSK